MMLTVCLVLVLSDMPTWGKGIALMFMGFSFAYQRWMQKPAARLVQLVQFDKENWRCSVQIFHRIHKTNIVEGRLVSVQGWLFVLVLRFETTDNNKQVTKNWVIWRDQVDAENWRRLIVIKRFWADDVQRVID